MILNVGKTTIISITRKTAGFHFNYNLSNKPILRYRYVKDLGVLLDCKLYFHHHSDYISSQGLKMLGLIRYITSSFSTPHSLSVLYTTLVRPNLEYASVAWNSITSTGLSKLERVKEKLLPCTIAEFLRVFVAVTMKVNYVDLIFQHFIPDGNILMLFFLLMYLKIKLVILLYLIPLTYVYPVGEL
jgi:hypothetical protein